MSWEDRHDEMTFCVLPSMAKLFQRFERTAYPEMTCRTCHGVDGEAVRYKLPHGLSPLDPAKMPDPKSDEVEVIRSPWAPIPAAPVRRVDRG
jgi:hypothetical protein